VGAAASRHHNRLVDEDAADADVDEGNRVGSWTIDEGAPAMIDDFLS